MFRKILTTGLMSAGMIAVMAVPAFANHDTPHFPDPCPGNHVQVYNDAGDHNFPEVGGQFVCGPLKGDKGDTGETGATGPKGDTGEQGIQGEKGDTGAAGADGINGVDGKDGVDGVDGAVGPLGNQGYSICPDGAVLGLGSYDCTGHLAAAGPVGPQGPAGPVGPVGGTATAAPATAAPVAPSAPAVAPAGALAHTGSNWTYPLAAGALVLILMGFGLRKYSRIN